MKPDQTADERLTRIAAAVEQLARCAAEPGPRFLTVKAAGIYSGLSADSIRRLIESGKLTGLRPVPGRVVVDRLQLEHFVLSSTHQVRGSRGQSRRGDGL